jgi:hypothetical protein
VSMVIKPAAVFFRTCMIERAAGRRDYVAAEE